MNVAQDLSNLNFQVHYNLSYAYMQLGNSAEALKHMKEAKKLTGEISEGKHSVITSALDNLLVMALRNSFRILLYSKFCFRLDVHFNHTSYQTVVLYLHHPELKLKILSGKIF